MTQNQRNSLNSGFITGVMFFFASVIKSGEPWTARCEESYLEAKQRASQLNFDQSELHIALAESLKLQSHYAGLLNAHDGGRRLQFETPEAWIARLTETGTFEAARQKEATSHAPLPL